MLIAYWILAALLAAFYIYSGGVKAVRSRDALRPMMAWVDTMPMAAVRSIGVLEVLGALGLVLPPLAQVQPWLALAAAIGLVLLQLGGIALHMRRGEARLIGLNLVLITLAAATAWLATIWL